ncbi:hypothetical protein M3Y97_01077500 [Aphelenchoides bicaudatus]|nr:hypothetical protein M3Y97_01077500 [Aphelenchoides bicaudatus]
MSRLFYLLIFLLAFFTIVQCLRCYNCYNDTDCSRPLNEMHHNECGNGKSCVYTSDKDGKVNGRGCYHLTSKEDSDCRTHDDNKTWCLCYTDFCNDASLKVFGGWVFFGLFVGCIFVA